MKGQFCTCVFVNWRWHVKENIEKLLMVKYRPILELEKGKSKNVVTDLFEIPKNILLTQNK